MGDITQLPQGLMAALQLRSMGLIPSDLAPNVGLHIDTLELYLLNARETLIFAAGVNLVVGANNFPDAGSIVPPGELWYCWHVSVVATIPVAGAASVAAAFVDVTGTVPVGPYEAGVASEQPRASNWKPFWMRAGGRLQALAKGVTGVVPCVSTLIISRLRV